MCPNIVEEATRLAQDRRHQRKLLTGYFAYFLDLQCDRAQKRKQIFQLEQHEPQQDTQNNITAQLCQYAPVLPWVLPTPTVDHRRDFAWGATWGTIFADWLAALRWPLDTEDLPHKDLGVTWVEMAISLTMFAQMWLALRRKDAEGRDRLIIFRDYSDLQAYQAKLSEMADTVQQMMTQMATLRNTGLYPPQQRKLVRSTYVQGFVIHSSGLATRCQLPFQQDFLPLLRTHIGCHSGPSWTVIPELPIQPDVATLDRIKLETTGPWAERCRQSQLSAGNVRRFGRLELARVRFHS
eukprot:Skav230343  [mRNA]  locus=scaffold920:484128:485012:- [translate_table: standard]